MTTDEPTMSKSLDTLRQQLKEFEASREGYAFQLRLDFAEILWRVLEKRKWSLKQLAQQIGYSESYTSGLICGRWDCKLSVIGYVLHTLGISARLVVER